MSNMTPPQNKLVTAIDEAGGEITSLFRLAMDADMYYPTAYDALRELERRGMVKISQDKTRPGQPLVIRLVSYTPRLFN